MLENQGDLYTSSGPRFRSATVNELDRLAGHHRLDKHNREVIIAGEDRIARPRCPIEEPLRRKLGGRKAGV